MADLSFRGLTQAYLGLIWAFDRSAMSGVNQGKAIALQRKSYCNSCSTLLLHVLTKLQAERQEDVGQGDRLVGAKRQGGSLGLRFQ